jgi:hypothetical protein
VKKSKEEREKAEIEKLKEEIRRIMEKNNPSYRIELQCHSHTKADGSTEFRVEVRRSKTGWPPELVLTAAASTKVAAWRRLVKKVETAHGKTTGFGGSN